MRSNDAIFGFKNDYAWQYHVQTKLAQELGLVRGTIHWNAGSLHVYERHFYLVDHYVNSYKTFISKEEYGRIYPESPWR